MNPIQAILQTTAFMEDYSITEHVYDSLDR